MSESLDPFTLPLVGSRLIEASAGTGKTWTIAALYLRLVLGLSGTGAPATPLAPSRILVMTFTIAATRESSTRIRRRLVDAARAFREGVATDPFTASLIAAHPPGPVRDHAAWRLATAAEAMDDAAVVTIDAWVQRVLRDHAFDSGSAFDEVLDPDADAMIAEAVLDYWRQHVYPLTGAALDAALALWSDPEKLRADVRPLLARIERPDDEANARLADVYAETAARGLDALRPIKAGWVERFESMRSWIAAGRSETRVFPRTALKTAEDWFAKLRKWAEDPSAFELRLTQSALSRLSIAGLRECASDPATLVIPDAFELFEALPARIPTDPTPTAMRLHAARHVKARLEVLKERAGIFGFQDQLERLDRALGGPGGERLRRRIVAQYPAALIDEFQDTSPLQYRIFDRVYRVADDDPATTLLLIGDPKQSIYAFRDADIHSYLRARAATSGRHALLTINYRSTPALVAAVDRLFAAADDGGGGAFRFGAAPDTPLPFVRVRAHGRDASLVTRDGPHAAMTIVHDVEARSKDDSRVRFAAACAEWAVTLLADPATGFVDAGGGLRRVRPSDIAVLVRDWKDAAAVVRAFRARKVGATFLSDQDSVFKSSEAKDLVVWLEAVAEPNDARRARVAFATGLIGLTLDELAAIATDESVFEARIELLKRLSLDWREQGVLPMLRRTLHLLDLPARWLVAGDERRLTNVLHLAELLQCASARAEGEQALIRWLRERVATGKKRSDEEVLRLESDAELIRVVTIHGSKGLEYPVVCLPFAGVPSREPSPGSAWIADDDGVRHLVFEVDADAKQRLALESAQEELRLLYVALTRAQYAVWIGANALAQGASCSFGSSALGYLLGGGAAIAADAIGEAFEQRKHGLASIAIVPLADAVPTTTLPRATRVDAHPLIDAPVYDAVFERDWSIGSFSAIVRDLVRVPLAAAPLAPALEEELLTGPDDDPPLPARSTAARHRFPRGAYAGSFLHDQLEWLAGERFALDGSGVRDELVRRCHRQGWGKRADDLVEWLGEVAATPLPPLGCTLAALPSHLAEMEFWLPTTRLDATTVDALCRAHLLVGRERPPLPPHTLHGMLMGFVDLVVEVDGRYWVLDYKSNVLGDAGGDADGNYSGAAIEQSIATHRYDVQAALYTLALHRLLARRLGDDYDPARQLGGALVVYLRGIAGPVAGCIALPALPAFITALDAALDDTTEAHR